MRCEGHRRHGGAFTLGPVRWTQCGKEAIVRITVRQEGEKREFPACIECWNEAIKHPKIEVLDAKPIEVEMQVAK